MLADCVAITALSIYKLAACVLSQSFILHNRKEKIKIEKLYTFNIQTLHRYDKLLLCET